VLFGDNGAVTNPECVFAARPLANCLLSDPAVPIWPYESGALLEFGGPSVSTAFTAVDLDVWGRTLAEAVDRVASEGFAVDLRDVKETLAERFSELLAPLFADQVPDPEGLAAARDAYRKTLLTALANAYADGGADAPLRSAPAPLVLLSQGAVAGPGLLEWRYAVEYEQVDRAAQDQIRFTLGSEISPADSPATEPNRLFRALAEFAVAYPELRKDLEGGDGALAATALGSFVNVVTRVAAEWSAVPAVTHASDDGMATIAEFGQDGKLTIRVDGLMTPLIAGYTTQGSPDAPPFDYQFVGPDGEYLGVVEGRGLLRRQLLSPPRQIVENRTGTFTATVTRNEQLRFPQTRASAPEFVYHSAPVEFAGPLYAKLDSEQPVKLTAFATSPNTLAEYWKGLLEWIFGAEAVEVETSLSGVYESNGAALPIFLAADVIGAPAPAAIEDVVGNWMRDADPVRQGGTLLFDLTVTSTAGNARVPLLRLRNISVSLGDLLR
jgi:hypothetical protein